MNIQDNKPTDSEWSMPVVEGHFSQKLLQYSEPSSKQAKAIFLYQKEEKNNFKNSKAVLLISMAQQASEKEKLGATIELANKYFASCDVSVCDSLQFHTLQIDNNDSLESIRLRSRLIGTEWIARNINFLKLLKIPHKIFRWDEFLLDPNFGFYREKIKVAYEEDGHFKDAMNCTIKEFIDRYERRTKIIDYSKAFDCCFNYLAEECSVMMLMWQKYEYNYIIYPSEILKVVAASHDKFVVPVNPNLLKWLRVRVRTRRTVNENF